MNIWIFETGEPLLIEQDVRLHRYGLYSKYLSKKGHSVTLWTSTFSHAPKKNFFDEDETRVIDGITVNFLYGKGYKRNVSLARILHNKNFAKSVASALKHCSEWPDVILIPIPTIEVAITISRIARTNKIPTIVDIRDEWPDEIVNIAPKFLRKVIQLFFRTSYQRMYEICENATAVTGVSQKQCNYGKKFSGKSDKDSFVFPLGYPIYTDDIPSFNTLNVKFDPSAYEFNCCFIGTMGRFFDLSSIIQAAAIHPSIGFILVGDGPNKQKFTEEASGLSNVCFPGWLGQTGIQTVMAVCEVGLAPYMGSSAFSLPNKPIEYMSAGLAILSSVHGELEELISSEGIGVNILKWNTANLSECLSQLRTNRSSLKSMRSSARRVFEKNFELETVFRETTLAISRYTTESTNY